MNNSNHQKQASSLSPDESTETPANYEYKLQRIMSWVVVVVLTLFGIASLIGLFTVARTEGSFWQNLIKDQFPVIVGIPMAGAGALFVTLVLRISSGPIELDLC